MFHLPFLDILCYKLHNAVLVVQLDRTQACGACGWRFKSSRGHQSNYKKLDLRVWQISPPAGRAGRSKRGADEWLLERRATFFGVGAPACPAETLVKAGAYEGEIYQTRKSWS